jgi:molybdopterin/thiamine biosynthesis adenylyltransferase
MSDMPQLTDEEHARYEWQMWTPEVGEEGQRKLKAASVLVSRIGGVGGTAAYYLAAAGVGKLVLAHAGSVRPGDLNRQLLMTTDWLCKPRVECAQRRLKELNPHVEVVTVDENLTDSNAAAIVGQADFIVDAAPLFDERFAMNRAAVEQGKPLVECAMFDLDAQLTTIIPAESPCLRCVYPVDPPYWKRAFPVFGAVAGMIGAMAAMEVIKLITGIGEPLKNRLLCINLRTMEFRKLPIARDEQCPVCGKPSRNTPATGPAPNGVT